MKKAMALVLAAAMFASCLTGCGGEADSGSGSDSGKSSAGSQGSGAASVENEIDYTEYPVTPAEYFEYSLKSKADLEKAFHVKLDTTADTCVVLEKYRNENDDLEVIVVPPEIDGKPVVGIVGSSTFYFVNGVQGDDIVKAIILPDTVEVIAGGFAFRMDNLETLHLGNNLKCLGYEHAYDHDFLFNCPKLKELVFPDSLEKIGNIGVYFCGGDHAMRRIHIPETTVGENYAFDDKWSDNPTSSEMLVECASNSFAELLCDELYIMCQNYQGTRDLENYKQNREKLSEFYDDYIEIGGVYSDRFLVVNEEFGIAALTVNEEDDVAVVEDKGNGYRVGTIGGERVFTQEIPEEITKQYNATTYEGVEKMALDIVNHAMTEQQVGGEILNYVTIDSSYGPMTVVASGVKEERRGTISGTDHGEHFIIWKIYSDKIIGVCGSQFILPRTITPLG